MRESSIIQRDNWRKRKHVARTKLERKPALTPNNLFPRKNTKRNVVKPARAEGSRFVNSLLTPRREVERLTSQKKRGGFQRRLLR